MSGVAIRVEWDGLDAALRRLDGAARALHGAELLDTMGAVAEGAARRRIADEKAAPDGTPWAAWSDDHAATRRGGQSLLRAEGDLLDSLAWEVRGDEVRIGSPLVYAAIQQLGGAEVGRPGLPARPYLGLSDDDARELTMVVGDFLDDVLGAGR